METTETFGIEFLTVGIMIVILVIIPFYLMAKQHSYKSLKTASSAVFKIMLILTVGIFIIGLILNSFIAFLSIPTIILLAYYFILFLISNYQHKKETNSLFILYLLIGLFFVPIVWVIIDILGFFEFWIGLLSSPIDMR